VRCELNHSGFVSIRHFGDCQRKSKLGDLRLIKRWHLWVTQVKICDGLDLKEFNRQSCSVFCLDIDPLPVWGTAYVRRVGKPVPNVVNHIRRPFARHVDGKQDVSVGVSSRLNKRSTSDYENLLELPPEVAPDSKQNLVTHPIRCSRYNSGRSLFFL
jgi:hypothetical protein